MPASLPAVYHANVFVNDGGGTAADVRALAEECKKRVSDAFGIELEPEVRLL